MNKKVWKIVEWVLFIGWIGFILWMTLLSRNYHYSERIFRLDLLYEFRELFTGSEYGITHITLFFENILLFIPVGLLLPWKKKWWIVLITGLITSVFIEFLQYFSMLGECEIDDVIANTIGALVGFGIYSIIKRLVKRGENR